MAGIGRLFKHYLDKGRESLETATQIREASSDPDACACLEFDQRRRLPSIVRISSGSTLPSTLTNARPGSSMRIDPGEDEGTPDATSATSTVSGSDAMVTARSSARGCVAHPTPLRYLYRHWKTWLALTPFSRATRAIDAPGTSVASTMRRFSSVVRSTRFAEPAVAT
jgi:hypothetical protein